MIRSGWLSVLSCSYNLAIIVMRVTCFWLLIELEKRERRGKRKKTLVGRETASVCDEGFIFPK